MAIGLLLIIGVFLLAVGGVAVILFITLGTRKRQRAEREKDEDEGW